MNGNGMQYDSFIYTHIPKCGGTSFRYFLNESAKMSGIPRSKRYIPGYNWLSVEKDYHRLNRRKQSRFHDKNYKVVAMHVEYGWHMSAASYMKVPFYYIILRNPLNRVISHYQFFNKGKGRKGVKGIDIMQLDRNKLNEVLATSANLSIMYVLGKSIKGGEATSMMKDDALDNLLHRYNDFGILEESDKSISSLVKNWPHWLSSTRSLDHRNKTLIKRAGDSLSQEVKEMIEEHNRFEIEFYNTAKALFFRRVK